MEKTATKRPRRWFSPEQKYEILQDIEKQPTVKAGLLRHGISSSVYGKWRRQLQVGIRSSLRNWRPKKTDEMKRLEAENRRLKEIVLNQSAVITDIKKEMGLD
jgi:transposase-like protein